MATAVQSSTEPRTPNPRTRLALASLFGALFVIAGLVVAVYFVPDLWERWVSPVLAPLGGFVNVALRVTAQFAVVVGILWGGSLLMPANPPRGLRGGIFLVIVGLVTIFFLARLVGLNLEDVSLGQPITAAVTAALLALFYRFLVSPRAERWMVSLEEQGWFHAFSYKRTQGVRARRYTLIGILILGWSGVYTIVAKESFGRGNWDLRLPFDMGTITLMTEIQYTLPVLLAVVVFWIGWRAVNMPVFADFLIATEAEMNKVSWSSRRRLMQDTIVVLVTCLILTAFLLVVDLFWGWLLSRSVVGVLPPRSTAAAPVDPTQGKKANW